MNRGISYFNFFWADLTNPSFERALMIAKVMHDIISKGGKVLVHCHAGQGRTALVIGAYLLCKLIFLSIGISIDSGRANSSKECIDMTRAGRPKCFSKRYNQIFIEDFYKFLQNYGKVFSTEKNAYRLDFVRT